MRKFEDRLTDRSRFHAVYVTEDKVPRMLRYLDPIYTDSAGLDLPEKFKKEIKSDEVAFPDLSILLQAFRVVCSPIPRF